MTQFWCLNKFSKRIKSTQNSISNSGARGTRILRVWTRKFRIYPDTPDFLPDSPDLKFYITCPWSFLLFPNVKTSATLFPHSPTSSPSPLSPNFQILHLKSISRPREPQIIVKDSLPYVFHIGVALFSSYSGKKGELKVLKVRASRFGGFGRFWVISFGWIISIWVTLLGSRRVLIFVGQFCRNQKFSFGGENCEKPGYSGY